MPNYRDSAQLISVMNILFERLRISPVNPVEKLAASRLMICIRTTNPTVTIVINGRLRPVSVSYTQPSGHPDLDVSMSADTLHNILTHEASLKTAFANGQMKVIGPIWKTAPLADILVAGRKHYPQVLHDLGLSKQTS